jgi:SOS-response transcriptional repressor LexA
MRTQPELQAEALTYITATLLETGKAPTMAQIRDHLGLKSRNSAHTIVLALEAAGEIRVTRFAISLPAGGGLVNQKST